MILATKKRIRIETSGDMICVPSSEHNFNTSNAMPCTGILNAESAVLHKNQISNLLHLKGEWTRANAKQLILIYILKL
jgi:hypothetical protein